MSVCSGAVGGGGVHDEQSNRYGCITVHTMDGSCQLGGIRLHRWMAVSYTHLTLPTSSYV